MDHYGFAWVTLLLALCGIIFLAMFPALFGIAAPVAQVSFVFILMITILAVLTTVFLAFSARSSGQERFLGEIATVIIPLAPVGRVRLHGEDWEAVLIDIAPDLLITSGTPVRVVAVHELRLFVTPLSVHS
jgi:membrane protein implicated in regulation of membrane protease activity